MIAYDELVGWAKQLMETEKAIGGKRSDWTLEQWIEYLKGEN